MALVNLNFESKYLRCNGDVSIILPDKPRKEIPRAFYESGKNYKVLWLLHGTFGDHTDWLRHTNIELYACERDLIVVMPSAINTNYENWPGFGTGYFLYDYITEELMPLVHNWFPASPAKEDNFAAGLSMGARGALKLILDYPDRFSAGAMLSAFPFSPEELCACVEDAARHNRRALLDEAIDFKGPFDPDFQAVRLLNDIANAGSVDACIAQKDLWTRLKDFAGCADAPRMYFACGQDDPNYNSYQKFQSYVEEIGIGATFEDGPGGHMWRFWDAYIEKSLDFFGLTAKARR